MIIEQVGLKFSSSLAVSSCEKKTWYENEVSVEEDRCPIDICVKSDLFSYSAIGIIASEIFKSKHLYQADIVPYAMLHYVLCNTKISSKIKLKPFRYKSCLG